MNPMRINQICFVFTVTIILFFQGCQFSYDDQGRIAVTEKTAMILEQSNTATRMASTASSQTPTVTKSPTCTATPTTTITPSPEFTWTALPRLKPDEARKLVLELYKTNGGCKLPCWWGFTPGESRIQEVNQFLRTIAIRYGEEPQGRFYYDLTIKEKKYNIQHYSVRDDIIERVHIRFRESNIYLDKLMQEYGVPGEVWIKTFGETHENVIPFYMYLFFPDQGMFILFESFNALIRGDRVVKCFQNEAARDIMLWSPVERYSFKEAGKITIGPDFFNEWPLYLYPIEEVTNHTPLSFHDAFVSGKSPICLETPVEIWRQMGE